jgi:predicted Zn-dependent protease
MDETGIPDKARRRVLATRLIALLAAGALAIMGVGPAAVPAYAQSKKPGGVPLIRDTEIEQLLRDYLTPILRVAGLAKQNVKVVIINDRSFNAFVMDGRHIFINAGALTEAKTPNEVIGVLAHEAGHLAGGHLSRMRERLASAQTQSIVAMLLGIGAMVATSRMNGGGVGAGAVLAPQQTIMRSLLAYVRTQEDQADHAAVKFLTASGQSAKGMYDTFKRLSDEIMFNSRGIDPYLQTHPMPADRVATLGALARATPYWDKKDPPELQLRHDLMRAKLYGFLDQPGSVARRYPLSDTSLPARYARAIATYRHSDLRTAIAQIDGLSQTQPNNPYFYELKGQALLEAGRGAEAVAPLRRALQLGHNAPLLQIMLAQALLASGDAKHADEAVNLLRTAIRSEPDSPDAYSQLAMAYGRKGDLAQADLASAQAAFARGDYPTARQLASRAKQRLAVGSPAWVRADDIATAKVGFKR